MALGQEVSGSSFNQTTARQFIAELWLPEMMAYREQKLLEPGKVCKLFDANVKKGDVFHIPKVGELITEDKVTDQDISIQVDEDDDYEIRVDTDRVVGIGIDNFTEAMASYNIREPYVKAMAYAMAKDVTGTILGLRAAVYNNSSQNVFSSSTGTLAGNGQAMSLAAILAAREQILDSDVDENSLVMFVSTRQETAILSILQATSKDYVSGTPTESGKIGSLYGIEFWRSSVLRANGPQGWVRRTGNGTKERSPSPGSTGSRYMPRQNPFTPLPTAFGNAAPVHSALLCSKEWAGIVMQNNLAPEANYLPSKMTTLIATRCSYGAKIYRDDHAVLIHTA